MLNEELKLKIKYIYKSWKKWDNYEMGRKGELYFNFEKMEFSLIQHTDRNSHGYIGEKEFWIPITSIKQDIEDNTCREAKENEIVTKIEKYIEGELKRRGIEIK